MDAWVGVVGIVIGVILAEGIRWLRDWREGKEKYRVMLYGKRLEVHQKAFYYVEQMMNPLRGYFAGDGYPKSDKLAAIYREAREFYYANSLYLDEVSRTVMIRAIAEIGYYLEEPDDSTIENAFNWLGRSRKAIEAGIGMKHLDEPKKDKTSRTNKKG